eukprot:2620465-Karenia_brevis.AAC.1
MTGEPWNENALAHGLSKSASLARAERPEYKDEQTDKFQLCQMVDVDNCETSEVTVPEEFCKYV